MRVLTLETTMLELNVLAHRDVHICVCVRSMSTEARKRNHAVTYGYAHVCIIMKE